MIIAILILLSWPLGGVLGCLLMFSCGSACLKTKEEITVLSLLVCALFGWVGFCFALIGSAIIILEYFWDNLINRIKMDRVVFKVDEKGKITYNKKP